MKKYLLLVCVLLLALLNLSVGSSDYTLLNFLSLEGKAAEISNEILWNNRLPRTLLAGFAGMICALCGLILQTIFNNPLAGPTTLGINSGASLGVALYYFLLSALGWQTLNLGSTIFSIAGALLFLFLLLYISKRYASISIVLIAGILLGYVAYSIIEILVQSSSAQGIKNYVFWGMGSFNAPSWDKVILLGITAGSSLFYFYRQSFIYNLYLLGEDELLMAGYNGKKVRSFSLLVCGIAVGLCTALVGPIAFVGIAVPNFLKLTFKTLNHQFLIPFVAVVGAGFAILADLLSRGALFSVVFPVNAILSIMAFPIIFILLLSKKHGITR